MSDIKITDIYIAYNNIKYSFILEELIVESNIINSSYILNNVVYDEFIKTIKNVNPEIVVLLIDYNNLNDFSKIINNISLNNDINFISMDTYKLILINENINKKQLLNTFIDLYKIIKSKNEKNILKKPYSFKLPDWCYSTEYILFDIQKNEYKKELLFIFVDKNGKKRFHKELTKNNYFYTKKERYDEAPLICNISDVQLRHDRKDLSSIIAKYEEDFPIELKHSVDYYYNRKNEEFIYIPKKMFYDIEVFIGDTREFPNPLLAEHPINAISYKIKNLKTNVLILKMNNMDNSEIKNEIINNYNIKFFNTEKELLIYFFTEIHNNDPDLVCGWNSDYFDNPYIFMRAFKNGVNIDIMSPVNESNIILNEFKKSQIFGLYLLDLLTLYKKMTQQISGKEESYSLSYIANKILGKDKISYTGTLNELYINDINKFIEYSATDTILLDDLDTSVNHINQKFELIKVCNSTWKRSETSNGLVDPLTIRFAKNNNKVVRNIRRSGNEKFSGAYVIYPNTGLYKWVVDFDFKSLYPSIICSLNLGHNTYVAKVEPDVAQSFIYDKSNLPENISIIKYPLKKSSQKNIITKEQFLNFIDCDKKIVSITGCIFTNHIYEKSFLTELLLHLMAMRDEYKNKIGNIRNQLLNCLENDKKDLQTTLDQYSSIQYAYKVIMNTFYGVIGNHHLRLYNLDLAKTITATGQECLKFSVHHLNKYMLNKNLEIDSNFNENFEHRQFEHIVYGDTDSMFVSIGSYML